jgi:hypothetical protein
MEQESFVIWFTSPKKLRELKELNLSSPDKTTKEMEQQVISQSENRI